MNKNFPKINTQDLRDKMRLVLNNVEMNRKTYAITRHGEVVALLTPFPDKKSINNLPESENIS